MNLHFEQERHMSSSYWEEELNNSSASWISTRKQTNISNLKPEIKAKFHIMFHIMIAWKMQDKNIFIKPTSLEDISQEKGNQIHW